MVQKYPVTLQAGRGNLPRRRDPQNDRKTVRYRVISRLGRNFEAHLGTKAFQMTNRHCN